MFLRKYLGHILVSTFYPCMNGKQKYYYCHYPMWSQELNILWGVRHHLAKARTSKVIGLKYQNIPPA